MRKIYFVLVVLLGFLLMPETAMACGKSVKKEQCSKEVKAKAVAKDCCGMTHHSTSKKCTGKCGHSLCSVSVVNAAIPLVAEFELPSSLFDFELQKPKNHYSATFPLDGYSSIWLIPKIS
ncbi:hypothetical protein [Flavobacterium muglaense]|uniref:Uncharacterized protein n=1 Tax=Flavobacterium muglaense TaxID=2764716 RepID=A0A923SIW5_9FLAO|nr:hypothetical protein [Flavobacterium muglaense]MBC5837174.1 hypothetical protein [Flavobacterium muglaense]MBC5843703.1 hypothetical protein [Flavobacterium muglaense]